MSGARGHRRIRASSLLGGAVVILGAACAAPADAAPTSAAPLSDAARILELEHRIDERDALIRKLEQRVERLEREQAARGPVAPAGPGAAVPAQAQAAPQAQPAGPPPQAVAQAQRPAPPGGQPPAPSGPGAFTVSEEDAQRALERALVQTGAALLPRGKIEFVPSVVYQYQELSTPGAVALTTTGQVLITENVLRVTQVQAGVLFRAGLPWNMQIEVGAPYDYKSNTVVTRVNGAGLSETGPGVHGFGDPSVSLTKQVLTEGDVRPALFVNLGYNPNLGQVKESIPLGKGFDQLSAGFTAVKRQDPLVFTGGFGYIRSRQDNGLRPGDEYIASAGLLFAVSPQTSLQFSQQLIYYGKDSFNGAGVAGSERVAGIFNAGLLSVLGRNRVITFSVGIGETAAAPNFVIQMSMPIRLN